MNASFDPFRIVNTYGAFGSITKVRHEVGTTYAASADVSVCVMFGSKGYVRTDLVVDRRVSSL